MIDERTIGLIHAGLDGELDEGGEAELRKALEQSEEARHYHSELRRLSVFIDKIPDVEPPPGLHARIVQDVSLPTRPSFRSVFSAGMLPGFLRYGFAAAAGLVLAVAIYESREELSDPGDFSSMVGTMTSSGPAGYRRELDSWAFEEGGASGEMSLQRRNGSLILEIRLQAEQPVEFSADLAGDGFGFEALAQMGDPLDSVHVTEGMLRGRGAGQPHLVVMLHPPAVESDGTRASGRAGIGLEVRWQGAAVQIGRLHLDGAQSGS